MVEWLLIFPRRVDTTREEGEREKKKIRNKSRKRQFGRAELAGDKYHPSSRLAKEFICHPLFFFSLFCFPLYFSSGGSIKTFLAGQICPWSWIVKPGSPLQVLGRHFEPLPATRLGDTWGSSLATPHSVQVPDETHLTHAAHRPPFVQLPLWCNRSPYVSLGSTVGNTSSTCCSVPLCSSGVWSLGC